MDDFESRLKDLEQRQRERDEKPRKQVFGSREVPISTIFLRDGKTGAVAQVEYDAATGALRVTKVR